MSKTSSATGEQYMVRIEMSEGSHVKYEYDEAAGALKVNFVFYNNLTCPFNYGEIIGTKGGDGDMLDAIVLSSYPLMAGSIVPCRPVAMMELIDRGEIDNKIICVPVVDRDRESVQDLADLSEEDLRSYEDYNREVAIQKNKIMEIKGFHGKQRAMEEIQNSLIV